MTAPANTTEELAEAETAIERALQLWLRSHSGLARVCASTAGAAQPASSCTNSSSSPTIAYLSPWELASVRFA